MPLILGTNSIKDVGYDVANSCRFDDGSSDKMTQTFSTPTTANVFTFSFWLKRSNLSGGSPQQLLNTETGNLEELIRFDENDRLHMFTQNSSGAQTSSVKPSYRFRDVSAWYHIVVGVDTGQGTDSDRFKFWVNGTRLTDFDVSSYISSGYTLRLNTAVLHEFGVRKGGGFINGYFSELAFVDGQQLDADQFGEYDSDTNIWIPKDLSDLTFGNNGFYLDFEDSSSLGNDVSGNNNDWTVSNLTSIDQTTDTCSNNFMTLNPLSTDSGVTLSEGNTESDFDASVGNAKGNIGLTKGRWYWEVKLTNSTSGYPMIGIGSMNESQMQKPTGGSYPGGFSNSYGVYGTNLRLYANGSNLGDQGSSYTTGDVFGIYLDLESSTKTIKWYKNGSSVLSYNITNAGDDYPFTCMDYNGGESSVNVNYNFGNPAYTISSGNSDDNGYGNFEYSPNISSTKYYAVCTKNLAEFG